MREKKQNRKTGGRAYKMRKQQLKRKNGEGKAAKRKLPSEKTGGSAWLAMVQGKVKEQFGRLDMKTLLIRNFPILSFFIW